MTTKVWKPKRHQVERWGVYGFDGNLKYQTASRKVGRELAKNSGLPAKNVVKVRVTTTPL